MVSEAPDAGASRGDPVNSGISSPWVDIRGLGKHFAGEVALRDVDIDIARGEVHGLVGANGAGKSTLIRCLAGVTVPDEGQVLVDDEELRLGSPQASERAGLAFIHQELNLVPHFSALENMLLGVPKATRLGLIDWKRSSQPARAAAERVGIKFSLETKVSELSVGERWLVMISKALVREASLIAMDEPTAALSGPESEQLFSIIRDLAASGVAILYVSHRLDEVLDLCDRITIFRDGEVAQRATRGGLDKKGLIRAIVGHEVKGPEGRRRILEDKSGVPLFSARDVARGAAVKGVSFDVYRGEILGLGGLVGSGRTEVARLAFGVDRLQRGHFEMNGKRLTIGGETQAIELGIALVPEERRSQGLMLTQSVAFNINIASLQSLRVVDILPFLSSQKMRKQAGRLIKDLGVKTSRPSTKVASLSGGNQQKALIARWLRPDTKVLILDEPSRGVDIGAREEIHEAIRKLARSGVGVIVISSDVEELAVLADRIVVMREGRVVGELIGDEITEARIVEISYHDAVGS
ncbi:MAG: sugar ABC transporter ATP-binding protein [Hyphomicrobiales bacterium]|nr:sugar ABC transporter ATP-binding protein [Hyphomicrobiales bacterium]